MSCKVVIQDPREGQTIKAGDLFSLRVDLELDEPWLESPKWGSPIGSISGERNCGLVFEVSSPRNLNAILSGMASISDSRIDCHMERALGNPKAGRGYEVIITAGDVSVSYGHLKRGSGRTGPVRVGDPIGLPGNTGRCVDGCGRSFVSLQVKKGTQVKDFSEFSTPLMIEVMGGGRAYSPLGKVPPGQLKVKDLTVGRFKADNWRFREAEGEIEVVLKKGTRVLGKAKRKIEIAF